MHEVKVVLNKCILFRNYDLAVPCAYCYVHMVPGRRAAQDGQNIVHNVGSSAPSFDIGVEISIQKRDRPSLWSFFYFRIGKDNRQFQDTTSLSFPAAMASLISLAILRPVLMPGSIMSEYEDPLVKGFVPATIRQEISKTLKSR